MKSTPRKRKLQLTKPVARPLGTDSMSRVEGVNPKNVREALAHAREQGFDEYKRNESLWLAKHIAPLSSAIETSFVATIQKHGPEIADATLLGAYLGGAIVRSSIEAGTIKRKRCISNVNAWNINERAIVYDGEPVTHDTLNGLFGDETAVEFENIRHPAARTVCSLVVCVSMLLPPQPRTPHLTIVQT